MEKKFRVCAVLVFLILAVCAVNVYAVGEPIEQQRQAVPNGMPCLEAQAIANAQQAHIDNMNFFEQGMGVPKQPTSVSDESASPTSEVQSGSTNNAVGAAVLTQTTTNNNAVTTSEQVAFLNIPHPVPHPVEPPPDPPVVPPPPVAPPLPAIHIDIGGINIVIWPTEHRIHVTLPNSNPFEPIIIPIPWPF
jgi:hypothetical protein